MTTAHPAPAHRALSSSQGITVAWAGCEDDRPPRWNSPCASPNSCSGRRSRLITRASLLANRGLVPTGHLTDLHVVTPRCEGPVDARSGVHCSVRFAVSPREKRTSRRRSGVRFQSASTPPTDRLGTTRGPGSASCAPTRRNQVSPRLPLRRRGQIERRAARRAASDESINAAAHGLAISARSPARRTLTMRRSASRPQPARAARNLVAQSR